VKGIRRILLIIIVIISLSGVVYSLTSIFSKMYSYHQSAKRYETVQKIYQGGSHSESLHSINKDYVGWIIVRGTKINYPVVKTEDNSFYLTHNFYRKNDHVGSIFMDTKNSGNQLDKNIILYGHNMKDTSMFGSLKKYLNHDYYQSHRNVSFDYLGSTYEWEIFSVYSSDDTKWMRTQFSNQKEFEDYIAVLKKRSKFPTKIEVTKEDNILTLSTCTNIEEDGRFIVHAKLKKKGNG
jgi:sortase B